MARPDALPSRGDSVPPVWWPVSCLSERGTLGSAVGSQRVIPHTLAPAILHGHVIEVLRALPAESAHRVVTSPPYWGLRTYGT